MTEQSQITIEIVQDTATLSGHVAAWDQLAKEALEPNIFYESAAIMLALQYTVPSKPFCFAFVYLTGSDGVTQLIGFFPFQKGYKGPQRLIRCYQSFTHSNCYLSTPLVHRDHAALAIDGVLSWMGGTPDGTRMFGFYDITGDGPFHQCLTERLVAKRLPAFVEGGYSSAFFEPQASAEDYLTRAISTKKRKEYRRQKKRLEEQGTVTFTTLTNGPNLEHGLKDWIDAFINMEYKQPKNQRDFSMRGIQGGVQFLHKFLTYMADDGRLILHTLALNGQPIAMKCNIIAANSGGTAGSFAFKISFDETYSRYSPGVLLELYNIEDLHHRRTQIAWMDSGADPDHPMIGHLWDGRRQITYITCGNRNLISRLIVKLFQRRNRKSRYKAFSR